MVRLPPGWILHPLAGSNPVRGLVKQPGVVTPMAAFTQQLTVPIGNDGTPPPYTFGSGGGAVIQAGPSGAGTSWQPYQCTLYTSVGSSDTSQAVVCAGPQPLAQYEVSGALAGGGSLVSLAGLTLTPGWYVWAVWSGGTEGSQAFLVVTGTKTALTTG